MVEDLGWRDIVDEAMNEGPHDWLQLAEEAMAQLRPPHLAKKRATIIALADARSSGTPEKRVFERPDTCSANIYHSKWKHDPVFARALEAATQAAMQWRDTRALRAVAMAREMMALSTPAAAEEVIKRLRADDDNVVLRAAFGLLDRADFSTAPKTTTQDVVDEPLSDEEQAAVEAALRGLVREDIHDIDDYIDTEEDAPHGPGDIVGPAPASDGT